MRILTVVGARPQFIKAGPVSRAFTAIDVDERLVHTGQHYDLNMSDIFFDALGLRQPDYHLGIGSGGHGTQTGKMLAAIEEILVDDRPDVLLVYGDTNSTLAGALAAAKLHVPVVHVEAGLRSFNRRMPEEVNRVLTDHISTLLFCPTSAAVSHLASEGISDGVHLVGDVMKDALNYWRTNRHPTVADSTPNGLEPGNYYLATVHRAENVDCPDRLTGILSALASLELPVVLPLHPRTRKAIDSLDLQLSPNIKTTEPIGYLEMLDLEGQARAVLTDSGGVQKEAYMLGVPCVTLRDETEWTETVEAGWNSLAGADTAAILDAVANVTKQRQRPELFGDGQASQRIASITARLIGAADQQSVKTS